MTGLLIRGAEIDGELLDVRIGRGRVLETGPALPRAGRAEHELQAHGGALLPGLTDHHLHLFATAADLASAACDPATVHDAQGPARALHLAGPTGTAGSGGCATTNPWRASWTRPGWTRCALTCR